MYFPVAIVIALVIFGVQLLLCIRCKNVLRFSVIGVLTALEVVLWGYFFLIRPGFYAYLLGLLGIFWVAGAVLAWMVYGIVQLVQKRRK